MRFTLLSLTILGVVTVSHADRFSGSNTFPHFRDLSGLPGAGFGLTSDGRVGSKGALALSTPIAYSLGSNRAVAGIASRSVNLRPEFLNLSRRSDAFASDGTGQILLGIDSPIGRFTVSTIILSTVLDNVGNLHWQLPVRYKGLSLGVGAQNVTGRPGQADVEGSPFENQNSRSYYAVATYALPRDWYVSLGKGDTRFQGFFGSVSAPLTPRLRAMVEGERFGWNGGLAYELVKGSNDGKRLGVTLFAGVVRGERTVVSANVSF